MIRHLVRFGLLAILLIAGFLPAVFAESEMLVLYRSDIPLYQEIARRLQEQKRVKVIPCPIESLTVSFIESHSPSALITLGEAGLKRALLISWEVPIIATLIDSAPPDKRVHLLSTARPTGREITLLKRLLPELQRVWFPMIDPRFAPSPAVARAEAGSVLIDAKVLPSQRDLPEALRLIDPGNTAVILSLDPALMNDATMQSILLASFQKRFPVVGISEGMVKKGAALAFALGPEELAAELFDLALSVCENRWSGNRPFAAWRLILNRTVLEKLGFTVPDDLLKAASKVY